VDRAEPLPASFFNRPVEEVARDLLGRVLVSRLDGVVTVGRIVETEAYLGGTDPASHAWNWRRTPSNEALYAAPGTWYVYRSYGIHWCANIVTAPAGEGAAVLLRALEPVAGLAHMRRRRGPVTDRALCGGPGRLCQALGVSRASDGRAVERRARLWIAAGAPLDQSRVAASPRIGITRAVELPLRYVEAGTRWASRPPSRLVEATTYRMS
jgi:DNA-3-methyladenine glycosylase